MRIVDLEIDARSRQEQRAEKLEANKVDCVQLS